MQNHEIPHITPEEARVSIIEPETLSSVAITPEVTAVPENRVTRLQRIGRFMSRIFEEVGRYEADSDYTHTQAL